jgi:non-heme chloroperoxidase
LRTIGRVCAGRRTITPSRRRRLAVDDVGKSLPPRSMARTPCQFPLRFGVRSGAGLRHHGLHQQRLYGLIALNMLGIHGCDGLPIVEFNKPEQYWDRTETLAYSYRLNVSYHPRVRYDGDLRALDGKSLILVGANDEAIDAEALRLLFAARAPRARVTVLPGINHLGLFSDSTTLDQTTAWLNES